MLTDESAKQAEKALLPKLVTAGKFIVVSAKQETKALSDNTVATGRLTLTRLRQFAKAFVLTVITAGKSTDAREVQFPKTLLLSTDSFEIDAVTRFGQAPNAEASVLNKFGMFISEIAQPRKAPSPILSTDGKLIVLSDVHPKKAAAEITVAEGNSTACSLVQDLNA